MNATIQFQSPQLQALLDAIALVTKNRIQCAGVYSFGWNKLNNAESYLQTQVKAYFNCEESN